MQRLFLSAALIACAGLAQAEEDREQFVESNLLGIFYHELGHAVIDLEGVPIFGQEEDAADVFSIFLIDAVFEEETALSLAYDASFGFLGEAILRETETDDVAWWDNHGPDEQRFYNTVCIFYGADPDNREEFAQDMGLPQERADYCPDEYDAASGSWGQILDEMVDRTSGPKMRFEGGGGTLTHQVIASEVDALNDLLRLSAPLTVRVEPCGQANAFYDLQDQSITMCTEFEDYLREMFDHL
jgi:hypothetical protein